MIEEKEVPVLFDSKEKCCGCGACFAICPVDAISMEPDQEGFLYPIIQKEKCIKCHQCLSVCVFQEKQKKMQLWESKKAKEKVAKESKNKTVIAEEGTEAVS